MRSILYLLFIILILTSFLFVPLKGQQIVPEWNTFLGGYYNDYGYSITSDSFGNIYLAGCSDQSWGNPIDPHRGARDGFVAKLDKNGNLIWNTFLGGPDLSDVICYAITTDKNGYIYVVGRSSISWGNPIRPFSDSFDAFIAKYNSSGNLEWNTFLGGDSEDYGRDIFISADNHLYVVGYSYTSWENPVEAHSGNFDVFVAKLDVSGTLIWNTFIGGPEEENVIGITGNKNSIYVLGNCFFSWGSPIRPYSGHWDAFVCKIDNNGNYLWHTFLGGSDYDSGNAIHIHSPDQIYVTGTSESSWGNPKNSFRDGSDIMIAKLDDTGELLWNTFHGSEYSDSGKGITTDEDGNVLITGDSGLNWGNFQNKHNGKFDIFLLKLNSWGSYLFNTFLGSEQDETGFDLTLRQGEIFIAGYGSGEWGTPIRKYTDDEYDDAAVVKLKISFKIRTSVIGVGGYVTEKTQNVDFGDDCVINIFPDPGYEIDKIMDNDILMDISNPFTIRNVKEDHQVEIFFKRIKYPPILYISGVRKSETAWIISKDYAELNLSIREHETDPIAVSAFILSKKVNDVLTEIKRFNSGGSYTIIDKYIPKEKQVEYKLTAISPNGDVVHATVVLIL